MITLKVTKTDAYRILSKKSWSTASYIAWRISNKEEFDDGVDKFRFFSKVKRRLDLLVKENRVETTYVRDWRQSRWVYRKL